MPKSKRTPSGDADSIESGAIPASELSGAFPALQLPVVPPFAPMEARAADALPSGDWLYEPKWDGFRCLAFRDGDAVALQSKAGQPLARYFPELEAELRALASTKFVLDGEIAIVANGQLQFDALLQRIHPAESRIRKLARETPVAYFLFDLLVDARGRDLTALPLHERRARLEEFVSSLSHHRSLRLSPFSRDRQQAERWLQEGAFSGLDGVIAKQAGAAYLGGERTGMLKIKRVRTADCVVGGFRYAQKGGAIGSLLLGLYNEQGKLDHVGFSSSFTAEQREKLADILKPFIGGEGFTGKAPGGPSRWARDERSTEWVPLRPELVCEVRYDHFSGGRFRHGTKWLRWRPEKKARQCTDEQVRASASGEVEMLLSA